VRLISDNRGQVRVIEAFFATVLLFSCLMIIPAASPQVNDSSVNLSATAQNVLLSLDSNGHLANAIEQGDWQTLKSSLEAVLPLTVWFNLTVFDQNNNILNSYPICNAGAVSDSIISETYVCVSTSSDYTLYVLRLQLSVED
jgi:hypothetical protein